VLILIVPVAARAQLAKTPWPMFGHDAMHTGLSPYNASGNPGTLRWKFTTGSGIFSSPVIGADGTIYIGSTDRNFYAINPDGTKKWKYTAGESIRNSAAIGADETIYFSTDYGNLIAVNPIGRLKWKFNIGDSGSGSPAIGADGTIYVCSSGGLLYALKPDGTKKWQIATDARFSPAIGADGTVYVSGEEGCDGTCKSHLTAVSHNGKRRWKFGFDGGANSSPSIGIDGTIYVVGIKINSADKSGNGGSPPELYAITPDGKLKWRLAAGAWTNVDASPAVGTDGTIYIGSGKGDLQVIGPDGSKKWDLKLGYGGSMPSPAIGVDGTVYAGDASNNFYAIDPVGSPKWKFTAEKIRGGPDQMWTSPAIGTDGTIYIGSLDYNLYAIGTPVSVPAAAATPIAGRVVISRETFAFGTVPVGLHAMGFFNVTADESNKDPLLIENISVSGINFKLGNHRCVAGQPLDPGQSCTIDFLYTPSMATHGETDMGEVVVTTNATLVVPSEGKVLLTGGGKGRGTPPYGSMSCRTFSDAIRDNPRDKTMFSWAMGFMAGRNADIPNGETGLIGLPIDEQKELIRSYCNNNSYIGALTKLVNSLRKKPGVSGEAMSCATFLHAIQANPTDQSMFFWAWGYMAALNTRLLSRVTYFDGVPADEQMQFLKSYCGDRPTSSYVEAVLKLFDHVRQSQGIPAPVWDTQKRR
jgi:outer membrane protein assembly factor BamB